MYQLRRSDQAIVTKKFGIKIGQMKLAGSMWVAETTNNEYDSLKIVGLKKRDVFNQYVSQITKMKQPQHC